MFDLARRFALLDARDGPATVRIARVVAEGRSASCPRCEWRVLLGDSHCENCGLENARLADATKDLGLPRAVVSAQCEHFASETSGARRREAEYPSASPWSSAESEWTGREAWRCGPKSFRRRFETLLGSLERDMSIDVICTATARPRWNRIAHRHRHPIRIFTPRSLVTAEWTDARVLVVDTPSAFDPASTTFHRLANAPHRFVIARASERRIADPDPVFALTDLVAPGSFASVVEARTLHRLDRTAFITRRDAVITRPPAPPLRPRRGAGGVPFSGEACSGETLLFVGIARSGTRCTRETATIVVSHDGERSLRPASMFWRIAGDVPLDRSPPALHDDSLRDLFATDIAENSRTLAASFTRLARAYAERIDLAPRTGRAALADEFARRAESLAAGGTLRICIDVVASVTLSTNPRS